MFDTINIWEGKSQLATLPYLINVSEHLTSSGEVYFTGNLNNYKVTLNPTGLNLKGSIAKFYLDDNIQTLGRQETQKAFEKMEDLLHIKLNKAKVYRLDVGINLLTDKAPESYFKYLGESAFYNRFQQSKSLYYTNSIRVKAFYNKLKEVKAKGGAIPPIMINKEVLRYELRFMKRVTRQLKSKQITPSILFDEAFYIAILDRLKNEFETINKIYMQKINLKKIGRQPTEKDFFNQLLIQKINEMGQSNVLLLVEEMKREKVFNSPVNYSRIKAKIKELSKLPDLTEPPGELQELNKKLKQGIKYYR